MAGRPNGVKGMIHRRLTHSAQGRERKYPDSSVAIYGGFRSATSGFSFSGSRESLYKSVECKISKKLASQLLILLLTAVAGCFDPYFYAVQQEATLNHQPHIIEEEVFPQPTTQPVEVNVGLNCQREPFRIGSIYDPDLEDEFIYRWHMTAFVGGTESQPTLVAENVIANDASNPEDVVIGPSLELDFDRLNAAFFNDVPDLVGKSHKLEFHVTDDRFLPGSQYDVSEDAGRDSIYWLVRIEEDDC
jgi:hypothetical protein